MAERGDPNGISHREGPVLVSAPSEMTASLVIVGEDVVSEEISRLLGREPTKSYRRGDSASSRSAGTYQRGMWSLRSAESIEEGSSLEEHVAWMLPEVTDNPEVWQHLSDRFLIRVSVGWFMVGGNEELSVTPHLMAELSKRHLKLDLDVCQPPRPEASPA